MRLITLSIATLIAISCIANAPEKKQVVKFVDTNPGQNKIFVEFDYAKSEVLNPEILDQLHGKKIKEVTYVYTQFHRSEKFVQTDLDKQRFEAISKIDPTFPIEKLSQLEQTACADVECASQLFHGFEVIFESEEVFAPENIQSQVFNLDGGSGGSFTTSSGTQIIVHANSFQDELGNSFSGPVDLIVKEGISAEDIVLGNLQTLTKDGQALESGGMIYTEARSNGKNLSLKKGSAIDIGIASNDIKEGMSVFEAEQIDGKLAWKNPKPLNLNEVKEDAPARIVEANNQIDLPEEVNAELRLMSWTFSGFDKSNVTQVALRKNGHDVQLTKPEEIELNACKKLKLTKDEMKKVRDLFENGEWDGTWGAAIVVGGEGGGFGWMNAQTGAENNIGQNTGQILDTNLTYAFSQSKLGWANIDRLANFKNSKKVNFSVALNGDDLKDVSISLIVPQKKIFLPGYKSKSGNYSFTHGDYEKKSTLPIGDEGIILATCKDANGDDKLFAIKRIELGKNEVESLQPESSTAEEIKKQVKEWL